MSLHNARRPFHLADSGGGGIPRRAAQRAILALALLAAALAAAALLHSSANAQTNSIRVTVSRLAIDTRIWHDNFIHWPRAMLDQDGVTRVNDLIISGKTTLRFSSLRAYPALPTLSNFTVSNGTLSNLRSALRPAPIGVTEYYNIWDVDVTPTADGPVTVSLPAGQLQAAPPYQAQRNAAASITLTAQLGPPRAIWADLVSVDDRAISPTRSRSAGDIMDFAVIFSEQVTVSGLPTVQLRTPGGVVDAAYHHVLNTYPPPNYPSRIEIRNGSGTSMLVFRHTVPAGGYSSGRTTIESNAITLPAGAMIADSDGNPAELVLPPVFETLERLRPGPGTGFPTPEAAVGDAHTFDAVFSEPVVVSREPGAELAHFVVQISTNEEVVIYRRAVYVGGSGTTRLTFQYVVTAEDDVGTFYGIFAPYMRVPQGFSIQNAAGIELSRPRYKQFRTVLTGYREGAQSPYPLTFSFRRTTAVLFNNHDVTVHLSSADPARALLEPTSFLLRAYGTHPDDWEERTPIALTLPPDADAVDNNVQLRFRLETTRPGLNGYVGNWRLIRITDAQAEAGPPCFLELVLSLADDSDNVVQAGDSLAVEAKLVYIDFYRMLDIDEPGRLSATGAVHWESNGRNRIGIPMQNLHNLGGAAPCRSVTIDGPTTWTCELDTEDSTIVVPIGTPDGVFTIHGAVNIDGLTYRGSLDVTVGDVDEVTSATLDFATDIAPGDSTDTPTNNWTGDDRPYPSSLNLGQRTTFQLAVLNENDAASAAGEIDSIVLTTNAGSLSLLNPNGVCVGDDGRSCQLPVNLLNATNSDNIRIELAHPGEPGAATVRATVIAKDGEEFTPEPLSVIFLGPPKTLAISAPQSPMLNIGTPDSGMDRDDLDLLTLSVTAADSAGNTVPVPADVRLAELRNPADEVVWTGSVGTLQNGLRIDWPLRWRDSAGELVDTEQTTPGVQTRPLLDPDGNLQVEIDIDAEAAAKLTAGQYTLKLSAGGLSATQRFIVSGAPAAVSLSAPQGDGMAAQGGVISLTATVTDANGNPVTDGTPVAWAEPRMVGESPVLVQVAIDRVTTGGTASASYQVVGFGSTYLRATAGAGTDVQLFNSPAPAAPPPSPAEDLTRRAPGGVSVWLGEGQTTASALLAGIPHATSIRTLRNGQWLRYSVVDGRLIPGSFDFPVNPGDILWPTN